MFLASRSSWLARARERGRLVGRCPWLAVPGATPPTGTTIPATEMRVVLRVVAPSNSSLQPTTTRHSKWRKLFGQRGRVVAAELWR